MTITHIVTSFMPGGAEMLVCDLANHQAQQHRVHLIILSNCCDTALLQQLDSRISIHRLNRPPRSFSPFYLLKARQLLQKIRPQVLHYHLHRNRLLFHYPARHIITVHGMPGAYCPLTHLSLRLADCVVAISSAVQQALKTQYQLRNTVRIHNGIHTHEIPTVKHRHYPLRLVNVARLDTADKAQDTLIRAVHLLQLRERPLCCRLDLIGDGSARRQLEALVTELGMEQHVRFRGQLPRKEVYRELAGYDLMVHPSRAEGFGLAVAEGMAAGLPVLVADCPALAEVIRHGELGQMFPTDSAEACAAAISRFAEQQEEAQRKAAQAKDYAHRHYSLETMAQAYEKLYLSA